jgi:hypothetical protein
MSVFILFVLSCVYVAALRRTDPPFKEAYGLCTGLGNSKGSQGQTKGCKPQ